MSYSLPVAHLKFLQLTSNFELRSWGEWQGASLGRLCNEMLFHIVYYLWKECGGCNNCRNSGTNSGGLYMLHWWYLTHVRCKFNSVLKKRVTLCFQSQRTPVSQDVWYKIKSKCSGNQTIAIKNRFTFLLQGYSPTAVTICQKTSISLSNWPHFVVTIVEFWDWMWQATRLTDWETQRHCMLLQGKTGVNHQGSFC